MAGLRPSYRLCGDAGSRGAEGPSCRAGAGAREQPVPAADPPRIDPRGQRPERRGLCGVESPVRHARRRHEGGRPLVRRADPSVQCQAMPGGGRRAGAEARAAGGPQIRPAGEGRIQGRLRLPAGIGDIRLPEGAADRRQRSDGHARLPHRVRSSAAGRRALVHAPVVLVRLRLRRAARDAGLPQHGRQRQGGLQRRRPPPGRPAGVRGQHARRDRAQHDALLPGDRRLPRFAVGAAAAAGRAAPARLVHRHRTLPAAAARDLGRRLPRDEAQGDPAAAGAHRDGSRRFRCNPGTTSATSPPSSPAAPRASRPAPSRPPRALAASRPSPPGR